MSRCKDEKMWRWEDVKMRRCEDEKMWRWEDVKIRRCEDVKMRRCEDEKMWRWEDVKMRRCEDEKMFYRPPLLEEPCAQTLSGKMQLLILLQLGPLNKIQTVFPESDKHTRESHQHKRFWASGVFGATAKMSSMPWKLTNINSFDEVSSFCDILIVFSRCVCACFCLITYFVEECNQWHSCVPDLLHQS